MTTPAAVFEHTQGGHTLLILLMSSPGRDYSWFHWFVITEGTELIPENIIEDGPADSFTDAKRQGFDALLFYCKV